MKTKSEEAQVISGAVKYYRATVKEYAVLGNINEVLQAMIDDLVVYTSDSIPGDWKNLASTLYSDLAILTKAAEDNGITSASVLSPIAAASQVTRNLTKLNNTEPVQKLKHYFVAIRNNLCDALKNVSPDPKITTAKSVKTINYNKLIRFNIDSVQSIADKLSDVIRGQNMSQDDLNDLYELLDGIDAAFAAYKSPDGRTYFDINPKFRTAMDNGLHALANPAGYELLDSLKIINNIISIYNNRPIVS